MEAGGRTDRQRWLLWWSVRPRLRSREYWTSIDSVLPHAIQTDLHAHSSNGLGELLHIRRMRACASCALPASQPASLFSLYFYHCMENFMIRLVPDVFQLSRRPESLCSHGDAVYNSPIFETVVKGGACSVALHLHCHALVGAIARGLSLHKKSRLHFVRGTRRGS